MAENLDSQEQPKIYLFYYSEKQKNTRDSLMYPRIFVNDIPYTECIEKELNVGSCWEDASLVFEGDINKVKIRCEMDITKETRNVE